MILRQTNHDLEKMRVSEKVKSVKTSPARRNESPRLRDEIARLLAKLSSLEKKHEILRHELKAEKIKNQETHKDLGRIATIYLKHETNQQVNNFGPYVQHLLQIEICKMDSTQLICHLEKVLRNTHNVTSKQGLKKKDFGQPDQHLEDQKVRLLLNIKFCLK